MSNKILAVLVATLLVCGFATSASAHQPRIELGVKSSADQPITVSNYEISQAFYGELNNTTDFYSIKINETSDLYLGLLTPQGGPTDLNLKISTLGFSDELNGAGLNWQPFYEQYGGDWYLKGPEKTWRLIPENYLISVSGQSGQGKYVLTVGTREEFPFFESFNALWLLPRLKTEFFSQPAWQVFSGRIYQYAAAGALIILVLVVIFVWLLVRRVKKKKIKETLTNI